jgi:hypothetical protein
MSVTDNVLGKGRSMGAKRMTVAVALGAMMTAGLLGIATAAQASSWVYVDTYATALECDNAGRVGVASQHFRQYQCTEDPGSSTHILWMDPR